MNTKEILYESIIEIKKLLSKKEISALELTKLLHIEHLFSLIYLKIL